MKLRGFIAFALAFLMIFGSAYMPVLGLAEDGVTTPSDVETPQETVAEATPIPTEEPTAEPTVEPTAEPTVEPTAEPSAEPTAQAPEAAATQTPLPEESAEESQPGREIAVRREANGMSEVILTVTDMSTVSILAVEGDWVKVAVSGVTGYIYSDDMGVPKSTTTPKPGITVTIFTTRRAVMTPGETVTLTSKLEGDLNGLELRYQWECDKGQGFEAVPGANDSTYAFAASVETLSYDWRLTVYYR